MTVDRRSLLLGTLAAGASSQAHAQAGPRAAPGAPSMLPETGETIDLWPGLPPGAPRILPTEIVRERSTDPAFHDRSIEGVNRPRMAVFRPARPNGAAVLIMPGGGYSYLVFDKEGYDLARLLADRQVTVFVLFYRLPQDGWAAGVDTALQDAQRAVRVIRRHASRLRIDPARLCTMGFSAGGHLCADLLARFRTTVHAPIDATDELPARPDLAAAIYPVVSMSAPYAHAGSRQSLIGENASPADERAHSPHLQITAEAPPTFLLHAEDDQTVSVENSLLLRKALLERKIAVETHLFADGGHGFALRYAKGKSVEGWHEIFWAWARKKGLFA